MTKTDWLENLSKNVKKRRKELNMSQQTLAEIARLSLSTVTSIEQMTIENPTLDTIETLGKALQMKNGLDLLY
jgi:transcriptional regulator with XRE-family HTH domain